MFHNTTYFSYFPSQRHLTTEGKGNYSQSLHHLPGSSPDETLGSHYTVNCTKGGLFFSKGHGNPHFWDWGWEERTQLNQVLPGIVCRYVKITSCTCPFFSREITLIFCCSWYSWWKIWRTKSKKSSIPWQSCGVCH